MGEEGIPMWIHLENIHEGAEATVSTGLWLGKVSVLKSRRSRGYRHPDLDRRLTRQRLAAESRILNRLSSEGFPSPSIIHLDDRNSNILMSKIEGKTLHDLLKSKEAGSSELRKLGTTIRILHEFGVSHGDLTTHNVMVSKGGSISLIDFGLSRQSPEIEHLGLDLQVLNECLSASHSSIPDAIEQVCNGYISAGNKEKLAPSAEMVVERFRKITGRVRYHG